VVHKNDLLDTVWPRAEVTEGVLSQAISELRSALDDDAREPRYIETIRNVGFRLIPPVSPGWRDEPGVGPAPAPSAPRRRWRRPALLLTAGALLILVVAVAYRFERPPAPEVPAEPSLLIFPFEDLSPDGGHEYLARGMAEEIAVQLASSPRLRLVSNRSFAPYLAEAENPGRLGRELGVDLLLTGSVQVRGDSIKLTAELSNARSAEQLWVSTFSRPIGDIFDIQDEAARAVAGMLLQRDFSPRRAAPTPDLTAYDYYLQGRDYLARIDPAATEQAVGLFREALSLDPDFAPARASLAQGLAMQGYLYQLGRPPLVAALEQAESAIALSDELVDAHYARALALMGLGRFEESRMAILTAIALSPNHIDAAFLGGALSDIRGELADAVRHYQRTLELNPRFTRTVALARLLLLLGREGQALELGRRGVQLAPGPPTLYFAHVLSLAGEHEEALMLCSEALAREVPRARNLCGFSALVAGETGLAGILLSEDWESDPRAQWGPFTFAASATHLALLRRAAGDMVSARELLAESEALTRAAQAAGNDHWALDYNLAAVAALRGDTEATAERLDAAYRNGFRDYLLMALDPALDVFRGTPAFLDLQRRIGYDMVHTEEQLGWGE
jgi:TolB-like protein